MAQPQITQSILYVGEAGYIHCTIQENGEVNLHNHQAGDNLDSMEFLNEAVGDTDLAVTVLADTGGQKVSSLKLPPLSWLDRRKYLVRKKEEVFPLHRFKTLCSASATEASFAAIDPEGIFGACLTCLEDQPHKLKNIYLTSLETPYLAAKLSTHKLEGWTLFLSWHEKSGIRFTVFKGTQVLVTRLLDAPSALTSMGYAAATIALDVKSTREYLTRLGLEKSAPFHLIAIMPPEIATTMGITPLDVSSREVFTPHEAAKRLKFAFAPPEESRQAEIIFLLWAAQHKMKSPSLLPSTLQKQRRTSEHRKSLEALITAVAVIWSVYLLLYGYTLWEKQQIVRDLRQDVIAQEQQLVQARGPVSQEQENLETLRRAVQRQRLFQPDDFDPQTLLTNIRERIPKGISITGYTVNGRVLSLTLTRPSEEPTHDILIARLHEAWPEARISITDIPTEPSTAPSRFTVTLAFDSAKRGKP